LQRFRLEVPRRSPQPLWHISAGGQGADQLQLTLGQNGLFGVKADTQAGFAALNRFDNRELGSAGFLYTDQVAGMERRGCQEISPRD
jgi:hypothetical protein